MDIDVIIAFTLTFLVFTSAIIIYFYGTKTLFTGFSKVINFVYISICIYYLFMLTLLMLYNNNVFSEEFTRAVNLDSFFEDYYPVDNTNTQNKNWNYVLEQFKSNATYIETINDKSEPIVDSITQEDIKDEFAYTIDECRNDFLTQQTLINMYAPDKRFHYSMKNPFTNESLYSITKHKLISLL